MSAIANFKARREAAKRAQSLPYDAPENTNAPENEALLLLAALLGCEVDQAIEKAREAVEKNIRIINVTLGFDTAEGQDQTAQSTVTTDDQGNIASISGTHTLELEDSAASVSNAAETALDAADKVSDSADKVSTAASELESAASSVDDSASSLAYTADDLGDIKDELKDVAAELKKPSEAPASSRGAKAAAPKSSSKKSS
uniref:Methyl-accepting chemotaxis sensory transducer n=1 Tax=Shewanella sp. (strain MR-7) TaxID=60481 RepID=Q0HYT2_SHESR